MWVHVIRKSPTGEYTPGRYFGIQHNKFIVADTGKTNDAWVVAGSANFTDAQLKSDAQNVICIQDESLAKAYTAEFEEIWGGSFGPLKN